MTAQFAGYRLQPRTDVFDASIPGLGSRRLVNVWAVVRGRSPQAILVLAHRDNSGQGPGVDDNASGTAAMLELARAASPSGGTGGDTRPLYTLVFLSTDAGAFGNLGARRFARTSSLAPTVAAAVNLDAIGTAGAPHVVFGGSGRQPSSTLLGTTVARIEEQTGAGVRRTSLLGQVADLAFPFGLYDHAPLLREGISALTLTTAGDRPPAVSIDREQNLDAESLGRMGRAAQALVGSLQLGLDVSQGTDAYLFVGGRLVPGWAVKLFLIVALIPYFAVTIDLFARTRRRRIRIAPALRSYRSRLAFWLWAGFLFLVFGLAGAWPSGAPVPIAPDSSAAGHWPRLGVFLLAALVLVSWLIGRQRLVRHREVDPEESLAGHLAALMVLGVVALMTLAVDVYALVLVLPSLHFWLWLPNTRSVGALPKLFYFGAGLLGPALVLGSFGARLGLGLDAPWYLAALTAVGYVSVLALAVTLAWVAAAAQLAAAAADRYAPYPAPEERRGLGPIRSTVRAAILATRRRRHRTRRTART